MRKLIMFITMMVSLITMIAFTIALKELFEFFQLGDFEIEVIITMLREMPLEQSLPALGVILRGIFQLYGLPLIVFLVSWNGLAIKK